MDEVGRYYEELAPTYDASRFGNSYGAFIDRRERTILTAWLQGVPAAATLDAGCGTGRMLSLAQHGVDGSANMIDVARQKWPDRELVVSELRRLPYADATFDAVICLHVFMHLPRPEVAACVREFRRVIRPGGTIIFDVPAAERRAMTGRRRASWHGSTSYALSKLRALAAGLDVAEVQGLLALPVHRLPSRWRGALVAVDAWLGAVAPRLASYYLVKCQKPFAPHAALSL
ncbi:MAG: class I SAM-dependent methyltransferase [Myxococcales bacterium]|nr:class I SAM-dependent methyltransferase [Myxococcales bacterium]